MHRQADYRQALKAGLDWLQSDFWINKNVSGQRAVDVMRRLDVAEVSEVLVGDSNRYQTIFPQHCTRITFVPSSVRPKNCSLYWRAVAFVSNAFATVQLEVSAGGEPVMSAYWSAVIVFLLAV